MKKHMREEQIVKFLREAEASDLPIPEFCRMRGINPSTYYRWKRIYGGLDVPEVKHLRQLEQENARLKRIVADRDLEIDAMKDLLRKNL